MDFDERRLLTPYGSRVALRLLLLAVAAAAGTAGVGATGLLPGGSAAPAASGEAPPSWATVRVPSRSRFVSQLVPADSHAAAEPLERFGARTGDLDLELGARRRARIRFRVARTLYNALVFESVTTLDYERDDAHAGRVRLRIQGPGPSSRELALAFSGRDVESLTATVDGRTSRYEVRDVRELPVRLGDFNIRDHWNLVAAVRGGRTELLGELGGLNSTPQLVLSADLLDASDAAPADAQPDRDATRACSALLFLGAAEGALRAVRFFDCGDRLVRTYTGFESRAGAAPLRSFDSFRIDSTVSRSSTVITIEAVELG